MNKSKEDFEAIRRAISKVRFESYRLNAVDTDDFIYDRYQWNVDLSEALYLPLRVLEVTLRNKFNMAFSANFANPNWLLVTPTWFDATSVGSVDKARQALADRGRPITQDRLVQELRFGFWTSLLNVRYDDRVFRPMASRLFPGQHPKFRIRSAITPRFEYIRKFRNRVFHHQRICDYDLLKIFDEIREAIKWMDPVAMPLLIPEERKRRLQKILAANPSAPKKQEGEFIDGTGI